MKPISEPSTVELVNSVLYKNNYPGGLYELAEKVASNPDWDDLPDDELVRRLGLDVYTWSAIRVTPEYKRELTLALWWFEAGTPDKLRELIQVQVQTATSRDPKAAKVAGLSAKTILSQLGVLRDPANEPALGKTTEIKYNYAQVEAIGDPTGPAGTPDEPAGKAPNGN